MPRQPAVLGAARLNNFRLNYLTLAVAHARPTRARILIAGVLAKVRTGSVMIHDVVNDEPNTCSLIVNAETPPTAGQRLRITINSDSPRLLFDGALETVTDSYDGKPTHLIYACTAQDDTPRANRRIPLGYWENISATTVAQQLVASFAPGFTTTHVQASLPAITILVDGSEGGMNGVLRAIAKLIGGYFYWEERDLHLFTEEATETPDDLDSTAGRFLNDPHIQIWIDDSQIRTRVYGKGHQEATLGDVAIGTDTIPLPDVSNFNPAGGKVISESQILTYTGTAVGGAGALVGTTVVPTNSPIVAKRVGGNLSSGAHQWAFLFGTAAGRTTLGPSTSVTLGDTIAAPSGAPTATKQFAAGNLSLGAYQYKVSFITATGEETTPGPASSSVMITTADDEAAPTMIGTASYHSDPAGALVANVLYSYRYTFFDAASGAETLPGPASNTFAPYDYYSTGTGSGKITRSGDQTPPSGFARRYYRTAGGGSTYKLMPGVGGGFSSNDGTYSYDIYADSTLGAAAPSSSTATKRRVQLTGIPTSADPNVTGRKIYRTVANGSDFKLLTTINDNTTTTYNDNIADGSLGASAPGSNTAVFLSANLSGISVGPSGTTYREIYRKPPGGSDFKLLTTLSNNTATTYTDNTADASLGAIAPTSDTSGLVGQTGDLPAGSTTMPVTSTGPFRSGGGWGLIGSLPIRYTGISGASLTGIPTSGAGALTSPIRYGVEIVAASILTGVSGIARALIKGAPINIWVQRDDLAAQAAVVAREGEGDGIIEHRIVDERRGEASLIALCNADLAQFSRPLVTVTYADHHIKNKSGKPITIDLPGPEIHQTLTIQDVTIDQIDIAPGLNPRYTVKASSLRYSVEDLLRRMATALEGQ